MSIRSACDRGFTTYLAEQHRSSMSKSVSKGLVAGGIASGLLFAINRFGNLGIEWFYLLSPLPLLTAASVAHESVGINKEDLEHKEAFEAICSKYDENDDEKTQKTQETQETQKTS